MYTISGVNDLLKNIEAWGFFSCRETSRDNNRTAAALGCCCLFNKSMLLFIFYQSILVKNKKTYCSILKLTGKV